MKIIDLLNTETLSLSFEVFPPKTETSFESVKTATEEIANNMHKATVINFFIFVICKITHIPHLLLN